MYPHEKEAIQKLELIDIDSLLKRLYRFRNLDTFRKQLEEFLEQSTLNVDDQEKTEIIHNWMMGEIKYDLRTGIDVWNDKIEGLLRLQNSELMEVLRNSPISYNWLLKCNENNGYTLSLAILKEHQGETGIASEYDKGIWEDYIEYEDKANEEYRKEANKIKRATGYCDVAFMNKKIVKNEEQYWFEKHLVRKIIDHL